MRCYYLNFTKLSGNFEEKKKHVFDYIMYIHNTAIHNRVFKIYETVNEMILNGFVY